MGYIYSAARQVILWMGDSDSYTAMAFEIIEELSPTIRELGDECLTAINNIRQANKANEDGRDPEASEKINPYSLAESFPADGNIFAPSKESVEADQSVCLPPRPEWVALAHLYSRPVFEGMWIIQELCMAKRVLVLCGVHRIQWTKVAKVAFLLESESWFDVKLELYYVKERNLYLPKVIAIRKLQLLWQMILHYEVSWTEIISSFRDFDATDPRDKIIALLGLRAEEPLIEPNYFVFNIDGINIYESHASHHLR